MCWILSLGLRVCVYLSLSLIVVVAAAILQHVNALCLSYTSERDLCLSSRTCTGSRTHWRWHFGVASFGHSNDNQTDDAGRFPRKSFLFCLTQSRSLEIYFLETGNSICCGRAPRLSSASSGFCRSMKKQLRSWLVCCPHDLDCAGAAAVSSAAAAAFPCGVMV